MRLTEEQVRGPALRFAITRVVSVGDREVTTICEASGHGATTDAVNDLYAQLLKDERGDANEE